MSWYAKLIRRIPALFVKRPILREFPKNSKDYKIGENISIGRYTYGKPIILSWDPTAKLKIGRFCSISENVVFLLGSERDHKKEFVTTYPFHIFFKELKHFRKKLFSYPAMKDIRVGNDVWIGHGAAIWPGANIGSGSIIGSNAVVAGSVEPYSIVVGNPGRVIKKRFDEDTIKRLLEINWWNWDMKKIKSNMHLLLDNNVEKFIKENHN